MSTQPITLDQWQLLFHEAMAAILRVKTAIKKGAGRLGVAKGLWAVSRDLKKIVTLDALALRAPEGTLTDAWIQDNLRSTTELFNSIEDLLDNARRGGFTNQTIMGAPLESIRNSGQRLAEHLDVLEMSLDPKVEELIGIGRQDFAEGRGIPLESLHDE